MKKTVFLIFLCIAALLISCSSGNAPEEKEVKYIELSAIDLIMIEGQTYDMAAEVYPVDAVDKEISWSSSNTDYCTVENGKITAKSSGTAIVKASCKNGVSSVVTVYVIGLEDVKTLRISEIFLELEEGQSQKLEACLTPATAIKLENVTWKSTNEEVATVSSDGTVTANGVGSCILYASYYNFKGACKVEVKAPSVTPPIDNPDNPDNPPVENPGDKETLPSDDFSDDVDLEVMVAFPETFEYRDRLSGKVYSKVRIDSYEINHILSPDGVIVELILHGEKVYDVDGDRGNYRAAALVSLYMEDDKHCEDRMVFESDKKVGEEVTIIFDYIAELRTTQRQFYVLMSDAYAGENIYEYN